MQWFLLLYYFSVTKECIYFWQLYIRDNTHAYLCTYQPCAGRPIQPQNLYYLCCVRPSWRCCLWAFPRQKSRCPPSQAEQQQQAPPMSRTPSAVCMAHPSLKEKRGRSQFEWGFTFLFVDASEPHRRIADVNNNKMLYLPVHPKKLLEMFDYSIKITETCLSRIISTKVNILTTCY